VSVSSFNSTINTSSTSSSLDLPTPPAFDTPVGGGWSTRLNIAMTFSKEKLEWCGYPMVKKFEDMFIRFDRIHECDRRTPDDSIG